MASLFRLRGRALQLGNLPVFTLSFLVCFFIILTVNFLPVVYIRIFEPYVVEKYSDYHRLIGCILSAVLFLVLFFLRSGLTLGNKRYFFKRATGKPPSAGDIFYCFRIKNLFSCALYILRISFMKLILLLFAFAPFTLSFIILYSFSMKSVSALVCISLAVTSVLLFLNGIIHYYSFTSSLFLCDYYFISGAYVNFAHIIASSQRMMCTEKKKLRSLKFSFSGWFLISFLIFPLTYVWSYYNQSLAVAAAHFMKVKEL